MPALFDKYADFIRDLPLAGELSKESLLRNDLLLYEDALLAIYYAPVDYVNTEARIALVGITPGWQQMELAFRVARALLLSGATSELAQRTAKLQASFAGSMRKNLITMLDGIGVNRALQIDSTEFLFRPSGQSLVHTTSAIRYPTFTKTGNYTGHLPSPLRHSALRRFVQEVLGPELNSVAQSLVVPLGRSVQRCIEFLIEQGTLEECRCLLGFPHPSGGNGHRLVFYESCRESMADQVRCWVNSQHL